MKNYHDIKLENCVFNILVIATSYENPINTLLSDNHVPFISNGKIVFDLTLINGKGNNRYAFADVENHKIIIPSIKVAADVDVLISNQANKFFYNNQDIIEKSILPKALKFLLLDEIKKMSANN